MIELRQAQACPRLGETAREIARRQWQLRYLRSRARRSHQGHARKVRAGGLSIGAGHPAP